MFLHFQIELWPNSDPLFPPATLGLGSKLTLLVWYGASLRKEAGGGLTLVSLIAFPSVFYVIPAYIKSSARTFWLMEGEITILCSELQICAPPPQKEIKVRCTIC